MVFRKPGFRLLMEMGFDSHSLYFNQRMIKLFFRDSRAFLFRFYAFVAVLQKEFQVLKEVQPAQLG